MTALIVRTTWHDAGRKIAMLHHHCSLQGYGVQAFAFRFHGMFPTESMDNIQGALPGKGPNALAPPSPLFSSQTPHISSHPPGQRVPHAPGSWKSRSAAGAGAGAGAARAARPGGPPAARRPASSSSSSSCMHRLEPG